VDIAVKRGRNIETYFDKCYDEVCSFWGHGFKYVLDSYHS